MKPPKVSILALPRVIGRGFLLGRFIMRNKFALLRTTDGQPALMIARKNGISLSALENRLRTGWAIDDAVTRPMVWMTKK